MKKIKSLVIFATLISSLFFFHLAFSFNNYTLQLNKLYIPHVYISGYGGVANGAGAALGRADLLAPVFIQNNKNLFVYAQGRLANQTQGNQATWTGTAGLGYRQILAGRIFGAYLLADYSGLPYEIDTNSSKGAWVVSPGIETLGEFIDFRINSYFPTKNQYTFYDYGNYVAKGNEMWADQYQGSEETGPGGDAELGVKLFSIKHMPLKAFINSYYFSLQDYDSIKGIGGRITFQPTKYLTVELKDSYDNNQHNVFMAGLRILTQP
jgi:hypothetical protein